MKNSLDFKSIGIGFLCATILTGIISFENSIEDKPGKYQVVTGEHGVIILDTQSGTYIAAEGIWSKRTTWMRGDFESRTINAAEGKKD